MYLRRAVLGNLQTENEALRHQLEQSTLQIQGYRDAEITLKATVDRAIANSGIWSTRLTKCQESLERQTREADKNRTFFVEEQAEKEKIKADYAKLLESSNAVTNKLREEVKTLRSQLEKERADRKDLEEEFRDLDSRWTESQEELAKLRSELSDLRQASVTASKDLPEAADLLNRLRARRKKSKADPDDMKAVLDILAELGT
ncbi:MULTISPECIES: hypothetical protein [unclassified Microcoleus]|uniref:hypothetical protein n=1 Tax=unclassified Microcoleus TaxID=2642155 RepID=UPI002FD38BFF